MSNTRLSLKYGPMNPDPSTRRPLRPDEPPLPTAPLRRRGRRGQRAPSTGEVGVSGSEQTRLAATSGTGAQPPRDAGVWTLAPLSHFSERRPPDVSGHAVRPESAGARADAPPLRRASA